MARGPKRGAPKVGPRKKKRVKGGRAGGGRVASRERVPWGDRVPPAATLTGLRDRLLAIGYSEGGIAARLGVPHPIAISLERYPVFETRLERREPLDVAVALFLLQGEAARGEAIELFGEDLLGRLLEAGLLEPAGRGRSGPVAAPVGLYPCAGGLFATDHRYRPSARSKRRAPREPVMYLGGDSYALAYLTPRRPVETVLDLCAGSGVHAILAARHAKRVVAVDREPRALAFGRLNAALNGVADKIVWLRGDLYSPLEPGARFDLILANPPFVPTPHRGRGRIAFRDAGPAGDEVVARLVAGLPARLGRDATAVIVSVFAESEGESFRARLERWLPRGSDLGALFLRLGLEAPAEYAVSQTRRAFGDAFEAYRDRHARWLAALRRSRVHRLAGGILALRPHAGPAPPWWKALDGRWPERAFPDELERAWRACEAARGIIFAGELLDRPARTPPDLVLIDELERRPEGSAPEGFGAVRHRARAASTLGPEVGISPELRLLLARCDGTHPLSEVVEQLAGDLQAEPRALAGRLFPDLLELAERGLLLLDRPGAPSPPEGARGGSS